MTFRKLLAGLVVFALIAFMPSWLAAQDAAALYKTKCQSCHAADGSGDTPMGKKLAAHDFRSPDVQKLSDADLIAVVTNGKNKMPAYKDKLTDDQIKQLVAYVRELGKKK
jgi:mono/diheme cytochrome c family protein